MHEVPNMRFVFDDLQKTIEICMGHVARINGKHHYPRYTSMLLPGGVGFILTALDKLTWDM